MSHRVRNEFGGDSLGPDQAVREFFSEVPDEAVKAPLAHRVVQPSNRAVIEAGDGGEDYDVSAVVKSPSHHPDDRVDTDDIDLDYGAELIDGEVRRRRSLEIHMAESERPKGTQAGNCVLQSSVVSEIHHHVAPRLE